MISLATGHSGSKLEAVATVELEGFLLQRENTYDAVTRVQ